MAKVLFALISVVTAGADTNRDDSSMLLQAGITKASHKVADLTRVKSKSRGTPHAESAIKKMKAKMGGKTASQMTKSERMAAIKEVRDLITCPYCKTLVVSFGLDVPVLDREGAVTQEEYREAMVETGALPYAQLVGGDVFFETKKHHHECAGVDEVGTVDLLRMDQNITLEHAWSSGIADLDGLPSIERLKILFKYATNGRIGAEELIAANDEFHGIVFGPDGEITTGRDQQGESGFNGAFPDWNTAFALMLGAFGTEIRTHTVNPFAGSQLEASFPEKLWNATLTWSEEDMRRLVLHGKIPKTWVKREWDATDPDSRYAPTLTDDHSVWKRPPSKPAATFWQTVLGVFGGKGSTSTTGPLGNKPYPVCVPSETPWAS